MLDFAVPDCLGDRKQFVEFYAMPMKRARQVGAAQHVIGKVSLWLAESSRIEPHMLHLPLAPNTICSQELAGKTPGIISLM